MVHGELCHSFPVDIVGAVNIPVAHRALLTLSLTLEIAVFFLSLD